MKIQIAFQGGGARFVDMLPAVAALQEHKKEGRIEITRVAGSSAGSICAALLALDASIEDLRGNARKYGLPLLRNTSGAFNGKVGPFRRAYYFSKVALGFPLVGEERFTRFLEKMLIWSLDEFEDNEETLQDIRSDLERPDLFISVADLKKGAGDFIDHGSLLSALTSSCAFPFAIRNFRGLKKKSVVDGGLTENLPTSPLGDSYEHGQKVLICPIDRPYAGKYSPPWGVFTFTSELFSTAINNQVIRAKGDEGDAMLLELESDLKIHQIQIGFNKLINDDWFGQRKAEAKQRLLEMLDMTPAGSSKAALLGSNLPAPYYRKSIFSIYDNLYSSQDYEIDHLLHVVRADCINNRNSVKAYDRVEREALISIGESGLACFRSFARRTVDGQIPTMWEAQVVDDKGSTVRELPIIPVPMDTPSDDGNFIGSTLLFFDKVKPSDLANKKLLIRSINHDKDGVGDLNGPEKRDFIGFNHRHHVVAKRAGIVLLYPSDFGQVFATKHPDCDSSIQFRDCTEDELDEFQLRCPREYDRVGVVVENLDPLTRFKVDFKKRS